MRRRRPAAVLAVLALGVGLAFGGAAPASGDAIDDRRHAAEEEQRKNEQARADAEEAMEGVTSDLAAIADRLLEIQTLLPAAQLKLDEANDRYDDARRKAVLVAAQLDDAKEQAADLDVAITQNTGEADKMRQAIGQMAREAYRGGGDMSNVGVILDADSSEDFIERADMVNMALRARAQVLDDLKSTESGNLNSQERLGAVQDRIVELKAEADEKLAEAQTAKQAAEDAKKALDTLLAEQKEKQATLEAQRQQLIDDIAAADAEADRIAEELKKAIEEQRERDERNNSTPNPPGVSGSQLFVNPTQTDPIYVTSEYGMRFHPILHYWRLHAGIDLRDYCGNDVYAGRDGTVLWGRYRAGYGNQVMIDHGIINDRGVATSYNHLSQILVSPGQKVSAGQLIARAGNTGTSAACHLHFEVYINGATTNPRPYLGI
ncbi:M23 family metallopeptidase [Cellulomonas composti]|nr:M23 family metallopeptidase [Cellulomonas composti]